MKHRLQRVCELLKRELGSIMVREVQFSSPLVTVSGVDITPDLKQAHIFISALGSTAQKREAIATLEHHRVMLQNEVSKRVILKNTPHFHFRLDESIERGSRVITIMDELGLGPASFDDIREEEQE
jgi:ribosome-binding factor A